MNRHPLLDLVNDKKYLSNLADTFGTPLYVYSGDRLNTNLTRLDSALKHNFTSYRICYAVKANSNPNLIKTLQSYLPHLSGDCSSPGELYAVKQAGIPVEKCIYTGNYESDHDLEIAIKSGCHINLDDISSFHRLMQIGLPEKISFRLNPGFGQGTFSQITTAGINAKFGIPEHDILDAFLLAKKHGVTEFGLQCMTGSGILDTQYFTTLLTAIIKTAQTIKSQLETELKFISMGGGFGIPYTDQDTPLDIEMVFQNLRKIFYTCYDPDDDTMPSLWVEPGKFIVGDAGILLTRVTGIKNSYRKYIGLDAGMETLMRPVLYNAYHRIYKVGEPDAAAIQTVDFTGRICENTDRLATDRPFPDVNEGDLIAIMDVGAYGYSMAHQFNTRPRPAEILIMGREPCLLRKRETIKDIFRNCDV